MNNDYDYTSFYKNNPELAEKLLINNSKEHFPDTYKLPNHNTFSNESVYSKQRNGSNIVGGTWNVNNNRDIFNVSDDNFNNNPNLGEYFMKNEKNVKPVYKNGYLLPEVVVRKHALGVGTLNGIGEGVDLAGNIVLANSNPTNQTSSTIGGGLKGAATGAGIVTGKQIGRAHV